MSDYVQVRTSNYTEATTPPAPSNDAVSSVRSGVATIHVSSRTTTCFITFDPPFSDVPVVVLTVFSPSDLNLHASISYIAADECDFSVWNENFADDSEDPCYVEWMACLPTDDPQDNCVPT